MSDMQQDKNSKMVAEDSNLWSGLTTFFCCNHHKEYKSIQLSFLSTQISWSEGIPWWDGEHDPDFTSD